MLPPSQMGVPQVGTLARGEGQPLVEQGLDPEPPPSPGTGLSAATLFSIAGDDWPAAELRGPGVLRAKPVDRQPALDEAQHAVDVGGAELQLPREVRAGAGQQLGARVGEPP